MFKLSYKAVRGFTILFVLILVIGLGVFLHNFKYSSGSRTGTLVKLSTKGILFKSIEGELQMGDQKGTLWTFSVLDKDLYKNELKLMEGMTVTLCYDQYTIFRRFTRAKSSYVVYAVGTCRGDE